MTPLLRWEDRHVAAGPPGAQLTHSSAIQIKDLERHVTQVGPYDKAGSFVACTINGNRYSFDAPVRSGFLQPKAQWKKDTN